MALVRKINPEWFPREKPDLGLGETIDITDPDRLILEGHVELATEAPQEAEEPTPEPEEAEEEAPKKKPAAKKTATKKK